MEGIEDTLIPELNHQEQRILELYEQIKQVQVEIELLRQQGIVNQEILASEPSESDIHQAQNELLEAKAAYGVTTNIISNVLIAAPIINSVHAGSNASVIEQDLLPLIKQRDTASTQLCGLEDKIRATHEALLEAEVENVRIAQSNEALAREMLDLANEKELKTQKLLDSPARTKLENLKQDVKQSRQRWRIIKGTCSATVVGSGVDWARNPDLLKIVLDEDNDDDDN